MSVAARLQHVNWLVETFLETHNAQHLHVAWYESGVQHQLLQHLACWCTSSPPQPKCGVLTIEVNHQLTMVPPTAHTVRVGGKAVETAADASTITVPVPAIDRVHALLTRTRRGRHMRYNLSARQPMWIAVGCNMPAYTMPPEVMNSKDGGAVVLQPTTCFRAGQHVFEVLHAPPVLARHRHTVPLAPMLTSTPEADTADVFDTVAAEIEGSDGSYCLVQCVSPPDSPLMHRKWTLPYDRGNVYFLVGTGTDTAISIPPVDAGVRPHHCRMYALMGYFWLVDMRKEGEGGGTYVCQSPVSAPWHVDLDGHSGPVHTLMDEVPVTLQVRRSKENLQHENKTNATSSSFSLRRL